MVLEEAVLFQKKGTVYFSYITRGVYTTRGVETTNSLHSIIFGREVTYKISSIELRSPLLFTSSMHLMIVLGTDAFI